MTAATSSSGSARPAKSLVNIARAAAASAVARRANAAMF
jgi:hypothetical protein